MNHKGLEVWKQSIGLAKIVYRITESFPPSEIYGMTAQMRRSAVSVSSNMAEGAARSSDKEFTHFLHIAPGSLAELGAQCILAKELQFMQGCSEVEKSIENVRKMTPGLMKHLRNKKAANN